MDSLGFYVLSEGKLKEPRVKGLCVGLRSPEPESSNVPPDLKFRM